MNIMDYTTDYTSPKSTKVGYAVLGLACVIAQMMPVYIMYFMTESIAIPVIYVSTMLVGVKVLDAFSDIIAGIIIDKTKSDKGKARPWLIRMAIPYAATLVIIFSVPAELGTVPKMIIITILYALEVSVWGTMLNVARYAIIPRMTLNQKDAGRFSAIGDGFFSVGGAVTMLIVLNVSARIGWRNTFILFAIAAFIMCIICYFLCKELPKEALEAYDKSRTISNFKADLKEIFKSLFTNKYALFMFIMVLLINMACGINMSGPLYYYTHYVGNIGAYSIMTIVTILLGLAVMPLAGFLVNKWKKYLGFVSVITAIMCLVLWKFGGPAAVAFTIVLMSIQSVFVVNMPMMSLGKMNAMVVDYGEWKSGKRAEGTTSAVVNIGCKIGMAIGSGLFGFMIGAAGFVEGGVAQPDGVGAAINTSLFLVNAIIFLAIAVFNFITWNLPNLLPQIQEDLAKRRTEAEETPEAVSE